VNDRIPSSHGIPGTCKHQDGAPCFLVVSSSTDYHYTSEPGAVMFAMRHSYKERFTVYDPDGLPLVEFKPRKKWDQPVPRDAGDILSDIGKQGTSSKKRTTKRLIKKGH
jgi:hypothetical protein